MYFEIGENGKIMVCAETQIKPKMIGMSPPAEFIPDEMHNWRVVDGEFVYTPLPEPEPQPTSEERIKALEDQLAAYEAAYQEGVNEA